MGAERGERVSGVQAMEFDIVPTEDADDADHDADLQKRRQGGGGRTGGNKYKGPSCRAAR